MGCEDILAIMYEELGQLGTDERIVLSPDLAAQTKMEDLRLDSLDTLQFAMNLEEKFGLKLEVEDFPASSTLLEIANRIVELTQQSSKTPA